MVDSASASEAVAPASVEAFPVTLAVEARASSTRWGWRCLQTLAAIGLRPWSTFRGCPEPVDHGRVLRFLASLRFPPWVVLVGALAVRHLSTSSRGPVEHRSIHSIMDPALAEVLSTWLVIMVPVGLPLLYFVLGLLAHVGIGLTGGAPRTVGASMRSVGYALGPALLAVAVLDLPLHFGALDAVPYAAALGVVGVSFWVLAAIALSGTHRVALARGFLVAWVPFLAFVSVTAGRASLHVDHIPGMPAPKGRYFIPGP